jgi:hypothetical protein
MSEKSRRILGAIIGASMGLAYSLVSQYINAISLPGVPLYNPPPGKLATILITVLIGGIMGLIAAWPEDALPGVLLSAVFGIAATSLLNIYLTEDTSLQITGAVIVFFMTFLPRAVLFLPLAALTRWVINEWSRELVSANFSIARMLLSLLLVVVVAGVAGALSMYSRQGRQVLQKTYTLIQQGRSARRAQASRWIPAEFAAGIYPDALYGPRPAADHPPYCCLWRRRICSHRALREWFSFWVRLHTAPL